MCLHLILVLVSNLFIFLTDEFVRAFRPIRLNLFHIDGFLKGFIILLGRCDVLCFAWLCVRDRAHYNIWFSAVKS